MRKKYTEENGYIINKKDLQNKEIKTLEKIYDAIQEAYKNCLENVKHFDNKASLFLVVYVGLFTIFSCLIQHIPLCNDINETLFNWLFVLTIISYIVAIIILLMTIFTRKYVSTKPRGLCSQHNTYQLWLIEQITDISKNLAGTRERTKTKDTCFQFGCIFLGISVVLTLALSMVVVFTIT